MSDEGWILIGAALNQLKQSSTVDLEGYANAEHALLSKLHQGLIPCRAASFVKSVTFNGYPRGREILHDVTIEPDFWIPEFAFGVSGEQDNENHALRYRWDWVRSTFLRGRNVNDRELGLPAAQIEEAVGVRVDVIALASCFGSKPQTKTRAKAAAAAVGNGGRPAEYRWEDAMAHLVALAIMGDIDEDAKSGKIADLLKDWCLENEGEEPAESTARTHANKVISALNQLKILRR